MADVTCFMLEATGRSIQWLRRWGHEQAVLNGRPHTHQAHVEIARVDGIDHVSGEVSWSRDDPRWPKACACGYVFTPDDSWLVDYWHEMRRSDGGDPICVQDAPVGAMWWAPWLGDRRWGEFFASTEHAARGGGPHLIVKTPAGDWDIDSKAKNGTNGSGWTRTGTPPLVTARPSIGFQRDDGSFLYHAYLTNGILKDC